MPLIYEESVGDLVNACASCGDWPVTTFNDRCLVCHEGHLEPIDRSNQ